MKITYVYDALCGWCFGFSPVILKFYEKYKDEIDFEVVSGGMITGSRVGPIGEVAAYIQSAYKTVEEVCGVKFGSEFLSKTLAEGQAIFTSWPPAIALSIIKETQPHNSLWFATKLQKAIYVDGMKPTQLEAYGQLASNFGMQSHHFMENMNKPHYQKLAKRDFERSKALEVNGFPTLVAEQGDQFISLCRGYLPFAQLENNYLKYKSEKK